MKRPLRFYAFIFAGVFSALIVLSATVVLLQVIHHIDQHDEQELTHTLADKARVASQLVRFYRGVTERIAREPETVEHLLFRDPARAEQWSASIRRRLPGVIGVALFTDDGGILGDAPAQRVGPECLADMGKLAAGAPLPGPPVHRTVPSLAHFDIVWPVTDQDRRIGLLFLGVSNAMLKTHLEEITAVNEAVTLVDAQGVVIATTGRTLSGDNVLTQSVAVPDTDWTLRYRVMEEPLQEVYFSFASATAITVLVIAGAMVALVSLAVRRLTGDLQTIQRKLQTLGDRAAPADTTDTVYLRETEAMLPALDRIAGVIHQRQQQLEALSETDDLTGLPNRRAFESQFGHYTGLAQRGTAVVLGLIDIDYFKPINDEFGHVTGDEVLRRLAKALQSSVRASDFVARVGGDEFVVVLVDIETGGLADWFIRLRTRFQSNPPANIPAERLSLSGGFLPLDTEHALPLSTALTRADEALYTAKGAGRGQCRIYGSEER